MGLRRRVGLNKETMKNGKKYGSHSQEESVFLPRLASELPLPDGGDAALPSQRFWATETQSSREELGDAPRGGEHKAPSVRIPAAGSRSIRVLMAGR